MKKTISTIAVAVSALTIFGACQSPSDEITLPEDPAAMSDPAATSNPTATSTSTPASAPESDAEPATGLVTVAVTDPLVGSNSDFGTFHLRDGCPVFENVHDGVSYAVAVPAERGGFLLDDPPGLQIPMHRIGFDDGVVYRVLGAPISDHASTPFVDPPASGCPGAVFLVLETRLADGQRPAGNAIAVGLDCTDTGTGTAANECPLQVAYYGRVWVETALSATPKELVAESVDGLAGAALWSTSSTDVIALVAADDDTIFLTPSS